MPNSKLVIVSTRLPISVSKIDGKLVYKPSPGGLATGVSTVSKSRDSVWVGWPGISSDELTNQDKRDIKAELKKHNCHPVFLGQQDVDLFYSGYCNATLWPLFHYFSEMARYDSDYWDAYKRVNALFADETLSVAPHNSQLWVHDYQLMLLPHLLRQRQPSSHIGFFLHTPFPSYEIFRVLPERKSILEGLLGADLIGFHTYDYVRHFLSSLSHNLGVENTLGNVQYDGRIIRTDAFPIGIDYEKFSDNSLKRSVRKLVKSFDLFDVDKTKIILSVDRADYSKGIPARLDAFEVLLQSNPQLHGRVSLMMIAVPSREDVSAYQALRETIEQKVGRINGQYATATWSPINYRYQALDFDELTALYARADVMLVTPLRDGMNLVAKEYIATRSAEDGVLVLSEMAGAASELTEAIQVNPSDADMVADALVVALQMTRSEQRRRMRAMQERVSTYTIHTWANDFINELENASVPREDGPSPMSSDDKDFMMGQYAAAKKRLIFLDYDGTLREFVRSPNKLLAMPSLKVRRVIKSLSDDPRNRVMIVSGRPRAVLESYFRSGNIGLVAEHGGWVMTAGHWAKRSLESRKWKKAVTPILEKYISRTPGSIVEEKDFALVWHFRNVSPELAYVRKEELKMELQNTIGGFDVGVFEGNKIIEIKPRNMHKGSIVTEMMAESNWDFMMSIGDDYTDEDMFRALPDKAWTFRVGEGHTSAHYRLHDVKEVVSLLDSLDDDR